MGPLSDRHSRRPRGGRRHHGKTASGSSRPISSTCSTQLQGFLPLQCAGYYMLQIGKGVGRQCGHPPPCVVGVQIGHTFISASNEQSGETRIEGHD